MNAITKATSVAVLVTLGLTLTTLCLIGSAAVAAEPNGATNQWPVVHVGEGDAYDPEFNLVCVSRVRNGAKPAEASSSLADFPMHAAKGLNDGLYGNARSWIADAQDKAPWFQIDLGKEQAVGAFAFSRDRTGQFTDRPVAAMTIAVSTDGQQWKTVFQTNDVSAIADYAVTKTVTVRIAPAPCRFVKVSLAANGACLDEFEALTVGGKRTMTTMNTQDRIEQEQTLTPERLLRQVGKDAPATFSNVSSPHRFDVVNTDSNHLMVAFQRSESHTVLPSAVRLAPGKRQTVELTARGDTNAFDLVYFVTQSSDPLVSHTGRYRAYSDGETVMCVPVSDSTFSAMLERTKSILHDSKALVTDKAMPPETYIYTPGPFYRHAGIFARDFLYQLEGAGRYTVTAEEVKRGVDFLALKQAKETRKVGGGTAPKGAIPDHVYPDGRWAWGPGVIYGDDRASRPSMDEAMCFVTLGWHYGFKANWDKAWQEWFKGKAQAFSDAWNSVPRNPKTGLVTQWTTPDHIGADGITETHGAAVMWGFHDSYGFGGDDVGVAVLACNAAWALADMHEKAGDAAKCREWETIGNAMRDSIRAQFNPSGYLPWGVGKAAPTMASPDITGYAMWSGILTDQQADAASDWFAARYLADKVTGGAADLFHMSKPFRGTVRMARKADDVSPGRHVWPDMRDGKHWENLAYGYNAYQDGGYWYYMSLGVAATLNRRHPTLAMEWVGNAYADLAGADANPPYERIDGNKPVNNKYNASVGPLMGMGRPATVASVKVEISK